MDELWIRATRLPEGRYAIGNARVQFVHSAEACAGDRCVIHNPTRHRMSTWPMNWNNERGIVERVCAHGRVHPDPDQWEWWSLTGRMHEQVHACCGCCMPPYGQGPLDTDN